MDSQIQYVLEGMDAIKNAFDQFIERVDEDYFSLNLMGAYEGLMEEMGRTLAQVKIYRR